MNSLRRHIMMQDGRIEFLSSLHSSRGAKIIVSGVYCDDNTEFYTKFSVEQGDGGYAIVGGVNNANNQQIGGGGWNRMLDLRFGTSNSGYIFEYRNYTNQEHWVNKDGWKRVLDGVESYISRSGSFSASVNNFYVGGDGQGGRGLVGRFFEISLKNGENYTMRLLPAKKNNKVGFYDTVTGRFYPSLGDQYTE